MNYKLIEAKTCNIDKIKKYKLSTILEYSNNLPSAEINRITKYVEENVPLQLNYYKMINVNDKEIGCLLIYNKDNGILLDELYIVEKYRNKGIGTNIIKQILLDNDIVYLWVYKLNTKAISLYQKLGFSVMEETESRYYMKYESSKKF